MNKRISYHLNELKNELRKRALKEKDEKIGDLLRKLFFFAFLSFSWDFFRFPHRLYPFYPFFPSFQSFPFFYFN